MLKIGKGLKKKKKNKKGKKDQELFTEEELEKYRREHSSKTVEAAAEATEEEKPPANSEEFEKFKLLTAGVDDILKKTQGDLDRIKKESFFQRKPTPSELKAQEDKEKAEFEAKSEGEWVGFEEGKHGSEAEKDGAVSNFYVEEESESGSEVEDTDDIFDTAYVDAVESGQIKLAYVPDDDEVGFDDGPDPFDTTTADELLRKAEEEERKKKKEISLGSAVNVLSGRAERDKVLLGDTVTDNVERKRPHSRPRKIQDLCLLGSFDNGEIPAEVAVVENSEPAVESAPKVFSLLDDDVNIDAPLPEGDELITQVLVRPVPRPPELATPTEDLPDVVLEFDGGIVLDLGLKKLEEEEEFDEFTALAASSVVNQKLEEELQQFEAVEDDPFDTSDVDRVLKLEKDLLDSIEGQSRHLPVELPRSEHSSGWSNLDPSPVEVDPFDTAFAEQCAPGKAELRLLEEILATPVVPIVARKADILFEARILSRNNSEDFNPREGESKSQRVSIQITNPSGFTQRGSDSEDIVALSLSHRDLLGGSTSDLASLADEPLPPGTVSPSEELSRYADPFDTTVAEQVAIPGKVELKFLEEELLADVKAAQDSLVDDDFDPRGDQRAVKFDLPSPAPDLLASVKEEAGARPLTPYFASPVKSESDFDGELEDPFDTSHVVHLPGKQELRLIEQELEHALVPQSGFISIEEKLGVPLNSSKIPRSISDDDFNPRGEEQVVPASPRRFSEIPPPTSLKLRSSFSEEKPDLFAVEEDLVTKTLTPAVEEDLSSYIDPFDTSIAESLAPGKAELKFLETELVGSVDITQNISLQERQEVKLKVVPSTKPLEPVEVIPESEDYDPFDTSVALQVGPGKAELRLLESELVTK